MRRANFLLNYTNERRLVKIKVLELYVCHNIAFYNQTCRINRLAASLHTKSVVLVTPSQVILKLSWDKEMPDMAEFTTGKRKKPAGACSRKLGR